MRLHMAYASPAVPVTRSASHIAGDAHNPLGPQLLERLRAICGAEHVLTQPIQLRACSDAGVAWVARGAGSGLPGGALPVAEGVLIAVARTASSTASRRTTSPAWRPCSPMVRSSPWAAKSSTSEAGEAVSEIVSGGVVPGAIEMMDSLTIQAAEQAVGAAFRTDAGAALIIELDGSQAECEARFDGNLHPLVCYDGEEEAERAEELSGRILGVCVDAGGSITGEHGIGVDEKRHMPRMFGEPDLAAFQHVRCAIDPHGIAERF